MISKLTTTAILLVCFLGANAQTKPDSTQMQKAAASVCLCLEKSNVNDAKASEMEVILVKCMLDSAGTLMADIMSKTEDMDGQDAGEALGKELAVQMLKQNCSSFIQLSLKLAGEDKESKTVSDKIAATGNLSGTVLTVGETEFLSLVVQTETGRKQTLYYFDYVPNSDDWLKNPKGLVGKKVTIGFKDNEFYRPSLKTFVSIKQLVSLSVAK